MEARKSQLAIREKLPVLLSQFSKTHLMLNRRTLILLLSLLPLLQSCATYVPPTSGKLARIQFVGNQYYAYIDEGNSCGTRSLVTKEFWSGTSLRAGQRVWIEQGIDTSGLAFAVMCKLAYSFEPEEGQLYVSEFHNDGRQCRLTLRRVDGSSRVEVLTSRQERPKSCF